MKSFQGKTQRWELTLTIATARRIKGLLRFDLLKPNDPVDPQLDNTPLVARLYTDPAAMVDVLFVMCQTQADQVGIDDVQFAEELDGPDGDGSAYKAAKNQFFEELVHFFLTSGHEDIAAVINTQVRAMKASLQETINQALLADVETPATAAVKAADLGGKLTKAIGGVTSNGLPESSESIPIR